MKPVWSYSWELIPYLCAETASERVLPAASEATLTFRHGRVKPWDSTAFSDFQARARHDQFVCIAVVPETGRPWPIWCGIAPAHNFHVGGTRLVGTDVIKHGEEHVQAVGLEYLLDRRRMTVAYTRNTDGSANSMGRIPAFNERLRRGPAYPGNRSEYQVEVSGDEVAYAFGADLNASDLPYQWSVRDIAEYLLYWTNPTGSDEPDFVFNAPDAEGYNLESYLDNVYPLVRQQGRSVLDILKELFDRRGGYGARLKWSIETDGSSSDYGMPAGDVEIQAFSCTAQGSTVFDITFPPNPHQEQIVLDEGLDILDANAMVNSFNTYDTVVVRGAPVISCFSLDYSGSVMAQFEASWDSATETAYRNEVETDVDGGTRTADEKRKHEKYRRVYAAFRLPSTFAWVDGQSRSLNPTFDVNGVINLNAVGGYDNSGLRFLDWLPIPAQSAILSETVEANLQEPLAIVEEYDSDGLLTNIWHLANNVPKDLCNSARVTPGDREGLLWVVFEPKHILGRGHFNADTDETDQPPVFSFEDMIFTVAIEAPNHPTVTVQTGAPPALGPSDASLFTRTLEIDVPEAQVWVVAPATVVGVSADGTPQYHAGSRVTRDDTERLRVVAAVAAAIYGKRRTAIRMTRRGLIGGGALGHLVQSVSIAQELHDVNSPVTERTWDLERGVTSISTGWVELDVRALR